MQVENIVKSQSRYRCLFAPFCDACMQVSRKFHLPTSRFKRSTHRSRTPATGAKTKLGMPCKIRCGRILGRWIHRRTRPHNASCAQLRKLRTFPNAPSMALKSMFAASTTLDSPTWSPLELGIDELISRKTNRSHNPPETRANCIIQKSSVSDSHQVWQVIAYKRS